MQAFGRILVLTGLLIVIIGAVLTFFDKTPFLGKLPGDFHVKRDNFEFYFPLTSSIVVSILISLFFWIKSKGE